MNSISYGPIKFFGIDGNAGIKIFTPVEEFWSQIRAQVYDSNYLDGFHYWKFDFLNPERVWNAEELRADRDAIDFKTDPFNGKSYEESVEYYRKKPG